MTEANLAYGRVTGQFARGDSDPTIAQDALTLAVEVQRLTFLIDHLRSGDRQLIEAFADLLEMIKGREYR
jgi:hypothetical protein